MLQHGTDCSQIVVLLMGRIGGWAFFFFFFHFVCVCVCVGVGLKGGWN
jgi:hypothetical protein